MGLVALHTSVDTAAAWPSGTALGHLIYASHATGVTTMDKKNISLVWDWRAALSKDAMHETVMNSLSAVKCAKWE